jgi:hypothetical protein
MSHPSQAQIDANRRNSKQGHGPNTHRGKGRSSQNAIRHGLTGRIVVLPTEDMEVYKAFSKELVDSLNPRTPMEHQFAQTVADTQWRLNRARTMEDGMIALGHYEDEGNFDAASPEIHAALTAAKVFRERSKDFVNLSLYEQRLSRQQKEAMRQLRELQAERKAAPTQAIPEAKPKVLTAAVTTTTIPANTSEPNGFVYSGTEYTPGASQTAHVFPTKTIEKKAA